MFEELNKLYMQINGGDSGANDSPEPALKRSRRM